MSEHVRYASDNGLARITLDRPPLNVLTIEMLKGLAAAFDRAGADDGVRLIRLDALGKLFCAGVDVGDHMGDKLDLMMDALSELFSAMERVPMPSVSVVHGAALGGGCEVILGTDLCLASEKASFGQPEIRLGLFAPPASVLLPRIVGERRAMGLLLSGETIPAREAENIGLVNRVFPAEEFEAEVGAWQNGMLELSGSALRLAKAAVIRARGGSPAEAQRAVDRLYREKLMSTADANEGLAAFMEKRKPSWQHA